MKFIFAHPVYFHGVWDMFVYEGHQVKVKAKVTEVKGPRPSSTLATETCIAGQIRILAE